MAASSSAASASSSCLIGGVVGCCPPPATGVVPPSPPETCRVRPDPPPPGACELARGGLAHRSLPYEILSELYSGRALMASSAFMAFWSEVKFMNDAPFSRRWLMSSILAKVERCQTRITRGNEDVGDSLSVLREIASQAVLREEVPVRNASDVCSKGQAGVVSVEQKGLDNGETHRCSGWLPAERLRATAG